MDIEVNNVQLAKNGRVMIHNHPYYSGQSAFLSTRVFAGKQHRIFKKMVSDLLMESNHQHLERF